MPESSTKKYDDMTAEEREVHDKQAREKERAEQAGSSRRPSSNADSRRHARDMMNRMD